MEKISDSTQPKEKTIPTRQEIEDWNKYLKYFNDKVKTEGISDEELDEGDGKYAQNQFEQYHLLTGKNYKYDDQTKKMQDYYNNLYNSDDQFISGMVKHTYQKPKLSKIDGRIGSFTRNYYIPSYNYSDNQGRHFRGSLNPYTRNIEVLDLKGATPDEAQKIFKQAGMSFSDKAKLTTASK